MYGSEPSLSGLDPNRWWSGLLATGFFAIFDQLLTITPSGTLAPSLLAKMPTVTRNGTLYAFTLRPNVKFHHGRVLTADDVKFTLERLANPATKAEAGSLYAGLPIVGMSDLVNQKANTLKGIRIINKNTFTIELERPESVLLPVLSAYFASIVPRDVVQRLGADKFNTAPIGTGPFVAKNVDLTKGLTLERNRKYWQPGLPYLDRVRWTIGASPDLQLLRIEQGQQDMMFDDIPAGMLGEVRTNAKFAKQLHSARENLCEFFVFSNMLQHPALKDRRVRLAIAMAVDKNRLVRVLQGNAVAATGGFFSPLSPYYQEGLSPKFDPNGAKQLLAQAGFPNGFDITFVGRNFTPGAQEGQTVQQDLANVGIKVELKLLDRDAWGSELVKYNPELAESNWELGFPHGSYIVDGAFTQAALKAGCCNYAQWVDPKIEALAQQAHQTANPKQVVSLYKQIDRIVVSDDVLWVPMFYRKRTELVSSRVKGFKIPSTPVANVKYFSKYWLAR
jgi:ABC-type transport system substrate-binding protein